jgi:hypothetical protein
MKSLALLPIAGALTLFGSAFSGVWTPPGLEGLPTYEELLARTPWGARAEEETPAGEMLPISDGIQFRPHGVTGHWGDAPLLDLPENKTPSPVPEGKARTAANPPAPPRRPASRPAVVQKSKPSTVTAPRPSQSYQLTGSRMEYRHSN